ncbi:MAG TPA: hypothetical protein VNN77_05865 [candidate division Zixibacteria bacterium]|nr:hypothetical protein [candidate division Zixibacteria bacterium]
MELSGTQYAALLRSVTPESPLYSTLINGARVPEGKGRGVKGSWFGFL